MLFNSEQRIRWILTGGGDNGKSLMMVTKAYDNLLIYQKWAEKNITEIPRHIALNPKTMRLAPWIEEKFGIWPNGLIEYFDGLKDLPKLSECDVFLDEMSVNFNSRRWADMPQDVIDWFNTIGHRGIFIFGTAQNFLDIDVTIRRKVQQIIQVRKLMGSPRPAKSLPPVKRIWGVIIKYYIHFSEIEKDEYKRKADKMSIRPFLITKFKCSLYDTLQEIKSAELLPAHCIVQGCDNPNHVDVYGKPITKFVHV